MTYADFFKRATRTDKQPDGLRPFPYQCRLAEEPWPELLDIPRHGENRCGCAGVAVEARLARGAARSHPRHRDNTATASVLPANAGAGRTDRAKRQRWLESLAVAGMPGENKVSVHLLTGGSEGVKKATWADYLEEDAILIGTQDILLSRALMRGYGMSRYQWPVHFAWLHSYLQFAESTLH